MESLKVNQKVIEYTLERKKIKNCYISIKDGQVRVRVPLRTSQEKIEEMLRKRADWILENIEKQGQKVRLPENYVDGEILRILGKDAILKVVYEKAKKPKIKWRFHKLIVILPTENQEKEEQIVKKMVNQFYQELAEKEVEKAIRKMSMKVGIAPNQVKVKNLKSTWGNCSITRNISINRNVVRYSRRAIEYVCLHEICHLQNMNHSKSFWHMVEEYMPNYKEAEEELEKD